MTLLHDAVRDQDLEQVRVLLGLDDPHLNVPDSSGYNPLHVAAEVGNVEIIHLLVAAGFDPAETAGRSQNGLNSLHIAAQCGNIDAIRALVELPGVDVDAKGAPLAFPAATALHYTVPLPNRMAESSPEAAMALLDAGASPNAVDAYGNTVLHLCAARAPGEGHLPVLLRAIELGANVNARSFFGPLCFPYPGTPLNVAIQSGNHEAVVALMDAGAVLIPAELPNGPISPLLMTSVGKNYETFQLLIARGCDVHEVSSEGGLLHFCARFDREERQTDAEAIVRHALALGLDVNSTDSEGRRPIHVAAENSCYWLIRLLLEFGADVNARDLHGGTPLMAAATMGSDATGDPRAVRMLLAAGADALARNNAEKTALQLAHEYDDDRFDVMALLVGAGDRQWDLLPTPCPELETALQAVADAAPDEMDQLFQRLEPAVQGRIKAALLTLHRILPQLPHSVHMYILYAALE